MAGFLSTRQKSLTCLPSEDCETSPAPSYLLLLIGMASIGLPGTNGFVGEFLILLGAFKAKWWYGRRGGSRCHLGSTYFLWYYERAMLGPLSKNVSAADQ